jgi:hypothetical protein
MRHAYTFAASSSVSRPKSIRPKGLGGLLHIFIYGWISSKSSGGTLAPLRRLALCLLPNCHCPPQLSQMLPPPTVVANYIAVISSVITAISSRHPLPGLTWSMMHSQPRTRLCSRWSHSKRLALIVLCHRPRSAPTWRRRSYSAYGSISLRWILFFVLARCYGVVHKFLHVKKTNFNSNLKWLVFSFIKKCLCAYKIDQKSIFLYHQSHFLTWLDVTVLCISF